MSLPYDSDELAIYAKEARLIDAQDDYAADVRAAEWYASTTQEERDALAAKVAADEAARKAANVWLTDNDVPF